MSEVKSNLGWREECESLHQQLASVLAAIKAKDEAINKVILKESLGHEMIEDDWEPEYWSLYKALSIQPDYSALQCGRNLASEI